jgi:hypothetical protein
MSFTHGGLDSLRDMSRVSTCVVASGVAETFVLLSLIFFAYHTYHQSQIILNGLRNHDHATIVTEPTDYSTSIEIE